tara:strand:+ start:40 stop:924 length:885 start_codon:yes stop_codon:yes gene_type:complete
MIIGNGCALITIALSTAVLIYFVYFVVYIVKYIKAVGYATDNYIDCDKNHCVDTSIENYTYIPAQENKHYNRNISKFCAQLIVRLEYPEKYDNIYPDLLNQLISVRDKHKNPIFCVIFKENNNNNLWIIFRGTYTFSEFISDIDYSQVAYLNTKMKVHRGFYKIFMNIRNQIKEQLKNIKIENIFITGHSLGGAIATLLVADIYKEYPNTYVYCFGSPRVGDKSFTNLINSNCNVYNIVNQSDVVTTIPPSVSANFINKKNLYYYSNSGKQITFDDNWHSLRNNHRMPVYIKNI